MTLTIITRNLIAATIALQLLSCATKSSPGGKDTVSGSPARGEMIMIQSGAKSPTISGSSEQHWIQLGRSDQSSRDKLYGLLATGEWQQAIDEARRQIELTPGDPHLTTALAAAYASGHNYEMAGYYSNHVLKTDQGNADAMNLVGLRVMMGAGNQRGDFDDALNWFRKATDNDSTHVAAALNMGYLYLDLGDAPSAIDAFSLASNRCGRCYSSQYGFGVASARNGAWPQAKEAFEGILAGENQRAEAQYQLALVYKNGLRDQERAIKLLQNIVSDPDGRFKAAGAVKRVANISLRRMKATDRSAPIPEETIEPHGGEMPARAN